MPIHIHTHKLRLTVASLSTTIIITPIPALTLTHEHRRIQAHTMIAEAVTVVTQTLDVVTEIAHKTRVARMMRIMRGAAIGIKTAAIRNQLHHHHHHLLRLHLRHLHHQGRVIRVLAAAKHRDTDRVSGRNAYPQFYMCSWCVVLCAVII